MVSTLARSGPINVVTGILRHLDRAKFLPVVVTLSPEGQVSSLQEILDMGIEVRQLNLSRAVSLFRGTQQLAQLLANMETQITHSHGFRADIMLSRSRALKCGKIATLHSDIEKDYPLAFGTLPGSVMAWIQYRAIRKHDQVVSVSQSVASAMREKKIHSHVIPNGISLETYCPANDSQKNLLRREFSLPTQSTVFLHTGVLIQRKNPLPIIRAFRRSELTQDCFLVFAGDGPLKKECEAAAQGAENIAFLGSRSDVANLLKAADFLVSNSESEGLPMALLEACASGTVIIASDIPSHREVHALFPKQVTLFQNRNEAQLQKAMETSHAFQGRFEHPGSVEQSAMDAISDKTMSLRYQDLYLEVALKNCSSNGSAA